MTTPTLLLSFPVSQLGAQLTPTTDFDFFTVVESSTVKCWMITDKADVILEYEADPNFGGWTSLDEGDYTRRVLWASDIIPSTGGPIVVQQFIASPTPGAGLFVPGTTTTLTLSGDPVHAENLSILFDGVEQQQTGGFTQAGGVVTFAVPIPIGTAKVQVKRQPTILYSAIPPQTVTADMLAVDLLPVGLVLPYAGSVIPATPWLLCNGASLLRSDYPALFAAIGTTYGAADGTHFNLPSPQGYALGAVGTSIDAGISVRTLGEKAGAETVALSAAHNGPHTHTYKGVSGAGGSGGLAGANATTPDTTGSSGSGTPHNNMSPTIFLNAIIKAV